MHLSVGMGCKSDALCLQNGTISICNESILDRQSSF